MPEVPLLAVLPGTGGLTRVVDKRKVRRDHADFFCTIEEGIKGKRAVQWRLVDEIAPNSKLEAKVAERTREFAAASKRNGTARASRCRRSSAASTTVQSAMVWSASTSIGRAHRHHFDQGARSAAAGRIDDVIAGAAFWPLQVAASLTMRSCICASMNSKPRCWCSSRMAIAPTSSRQTLSSKPTRRIGWSTRSGSTGSVSQAIDVTSRTLVTLVEPGSCFVGTLAELVFAADRSYMLIGSRQGDNRAPPAIELTAMNFGPYPISHGLTRLHPVPG